jgi:hypothetical protein
MCLFARKEGTFDEFLAHLYSNGKLSTMNALRHIMNGTKRKNDKSILWDFLFSKEVYANQCSIN